MSNTQQDRLYPLFLSLRDKHCLIVGLGTVGCRKLATLLQYAPTSVLVLDLLPFNDLKPEAHVLLADQRVVYAQRLCTIEDLAHKTLVFACTNNQTENRRIADLCTGQGVLCNCITEPSRGSFHVPALARQGELALALSTSGASPALARIWRLELEEWLKPRVQMARLLEKIRLLLQSRLDSAKQRGEILRNLANSPLQSYLASKDFDQCQQIVAKILPQNLHSSLPELFYDFSRISNIS